MGRAVQEATVLNLVALHVLRQAGLLAMRAAGSLHVTVTTQWA